MQLVLMNYIQTTKDSHEYWPTGKTIQECVIKLFVQELGYTYLGDFTEREIPDTEINGLRKQLIAEFKVFGRFINVFMSKIN